MTGPMIKPSRLPPMPKITPKSCRQADYQRDGAEDEPEEKPNRQKDQPDHRRNRQARETEDRKCDHSQNQEGQHPKRELREALRAGSPRNNGRRVPAWSRALSRSGDGFGGGTSGRDETAPHLLHRHALGLVRQHAMRPSVPEFVVAESRQRAPAQLLGAHGGDVDEEKAAFDRRRLLRGVGRRSSPVGVVDNVVGIRYDEPD